jgi:hypothetical protein
MGFQVSNDANHFFLRRLQKHCLPTKIKIQIFEIV